MIACPIRPALFPILAAAILLIVLPPPAGAGDNELQLKRGVDSDEIWAAIRRDSLNGGDVIQSISRVEKVPVEKAEKTFRFDDVWTAAFDLDEDGAEELVVVLVNSAFCGTAGCAMEVYENTRGEWRHSDIGGTVLYPFLTSPILVIRDEDRSYFYRRGDPRRQRLADKYGFPTKQLDFWQELLEDAPTIGIDYVAPSRARTAAEWPAEVMREVDAKMRRRVGPKWDEVVAESERLTESRENK